MIKKFRKVASVKITNIFLTKILRYLVTLENFNQLQIKQIGLMVIKTLEMKMRTSIFLTQSLGTMTTLYYKITIKEILRKVYNKNESSWKNSSKILI